MRARLSLCILSAVSLAGCAVDPIFARNSAIAAAKDKCAEEGKQFIYKDYKAYPDTNDFVVSGYCVGPHDPGYISPPAASKLLPAKP
jgi:hypothetical protein